MLSYQLSIEQKDQLVEDGFVQIKGVLSPMAVEQCLRMIKARMGQGISEQDIAESPAHGYFTEVTRKPPFSEMIMPPATRSLVESAIGEGNVASWGATQLAIRFPTMQNKRSRRGAHLDGLHTPTNGVPEGAIHNFTGLVGTFLSLADQPKMGNFTVWPGGHKVVARWFAEHDYREIENCLPPIYKELGEAKPVLVEPGDVVLANYLLPHGIDKNTSGQTRYACFHRIKHHRHDAERFEILTDPWHHWEGLETSNTN